MHAIRVYADVAKDVAPKRARLKQAESTLQVKQAGLAEAQAELAEVVAKVAALQKQFDDSNDEKNRLRDEAQALQDKLERADKLVSGLSGEYVRWQASIGGFETKMVEAVGDVLVSSAFLTYAGPFDTVNRDELVASWLGIVTEESLPAGASFVFTEFLAKPTDVRNWMGQSLPADNFSIENGVITTRGIRWPLCVDPQGQANRWIRQLEAGKLKVIDLKMKDFLREIENGVQYVKKARLLLLYRLLLRLLYPRFAAPAVYTTPPCHHHFYRYYYALTHSIHLPQVRNARPAPGRRRGARPVARAGPRKGHHQDRRAVHREDRRQGGRLVVRL